jgi:hypothetical protein
MRNVIRITKEGKVRPIRRRAADAIPAPATALGRMKRRETLEALSPNTSGTASAQAFIPAATQAVQDFAEQSRIRRTWRFNWA